MLWEELTADGFAKAVVDCKRTCVLPMGVLERHGPHLPLGTDMLDAHYVADQAARREPAVVFPQWFLGQIYEGKCFPGTIAIPPKLLLEVMLSVIDEIGRNGFTRIILYNGHGGNDSLVKFLCQCQLAEEKPYQVYSLYYDAGLSEEDRDRLAREVWTTEDHHAGESETSLIMAHRPDLVKTEALAGQIGEALGRLDHVKPGYSALGWYANYPEHYAGDARKASSEKGKVFAEAMIDGLTRFIRTVKNDTVAGELSDEFFKRERELRDGRKERKA
ncbi:MAG: creatininase family protein [Planctomycetota bacterium]|nr:creatininase family protein [Planctomycetota bacterium]